MSRSNNLPFPLGSTFSDLGAVTVYSTSGTNLEGKIYRADGNPSADSGQEVTEYMIVRNSSGGSLVMSATGMRMLRFGTTSGWWNRKIRGIATAKTDYAVIPDNALLGQTIPANDLFYVYVRGPAKVLAGSHSTGTVAFTAGKAVYGARTGGMLLQILTTDGTAERHPIGSITETISASVTGRVTTVMVGGAMQSVVA